MRKTSLVTISLPPAMAAQANKMAKKEGMTRSELLRSALRRYLEEKQAEAAIGIAGKERHEGKLKVLKGSLADLM